ncbi:hypothetical protein ES319_D09G228000v1 [Gossypium barbadense]|uniref:DUF5637 domain-containing protein n=3 Tax=Gossypium TaxID=3633 RepID=A0A5J5Q8B5_GOSBA|nr:hypothetical protein ES319_D09G228000v1 [Gossypium barbadense]TYG55150.1 hypothetical protein ES288_D09G248700v1 [Gossypium darwinii]
MGLLHLQAIPHTKNIIMERCKKFAFLMVAMALLLQSMVPPTALAARNNVMEYNPLASLFSREGPGCIAKGGFCLFDLTSCCRPCGCLAGWCYNIDHNCNEYT